MALRDIYFAGKGLRTCKEWLCRNTLEGACRKVLSVQCSEPVKNMKITVVGGGNIGTMMAAEAACKGHEVTVYTSTPERWQKEISVYNAEDKLLLTGTLSRVTDSMEMAVKDADYIWVVMPAQLFTGLASKMLPYVHKGQKIGFVPGSGGAEFAFREIAAKGCTLFGLQRVHSIARLKEYGKATYQLGRKSSLQIGAIPASETAGICKMMENIFDMQCDGLNNYLSVTLTPSNPILHTARLYSMFQDYKQGDVYPRNFLFYEEWMDYSSEVLIACDRELQELCKAIPLELGSVMSLRDYYESRTANAMTKKIRGIKAFKGLTSPMKEAEGGWVPDWHSRYFTADFAFGLKIIKDIAEMFGVATPNIDMIWKWYERTAMEDDVQVFHTELTADEFVKMYRCGW